MHLTDNGLAALRIPFGLHLLLSSQRHGALTCLQSGNKSVSGSSNLSYRREICFLPC